jgi:hypothetical protein
MGDEILRKDARVIEESKPRMHAKGTANAREWIRLLRQRPDYGATGSEQQTKPQMNPPSQNDSTELAEVLWRDRLEIYADVGRERNRREKGPRMGTNTGPLGRQCSDGHMRG